VEELREARRSADRAAELTRQLLAYGRRQVLRPQRVALNAVIEDMSSLLTRLIGAGVRMERDLGEDADPVLVDPGRLEQVVMNLAINARDAMPAGGVLRLRTRNDRVSAAAATRFPFPFIPGDYVRLEVSDTGIGMDAALQTRIFEPFFTTKPKHVGTGLGLATVYGIVKQSGGYITVESRPGKGTTFRVYLPVPEASESRPGEPASEPLELRVSGTETVLVVEDDTAVRSLVLRVLQRQGFAVLEATDGREALEVLRAAERRVDVLITDAIMPEMSGTDLIREARVAHPAVRALLISGYGESDLAGGTPYLAKPFTPDQLVHRVRQVLDA
jgi:CheY-like chemotaxis protein